MSWPQLSSCPDPYACVCLCFVECVRNKQCISTLDYSSKTNKMTSKVNSWIDFSSIVVVWKCYPRGIPGVYWLYISCVVFMTLILLHRLFCWSMIWGGMNGKDNLFSFLWVYLWWPRIFTMSVSLAVSVEWYILVMVLVSVTSVFVLTSESVSQLVIQWFSD